jgi:hypothetical protein
MSHTRDESAPRPFHILDRFHIVAKMNTALDEVRAGESRPMAHEGFVPVLKKWCRQIVRRAAVRFPLLFHAG